MAEQPLEPIRVTQTIAPIGITNPRPGVYIFDMGQNLVGFCRFTVTGPAGALVTLRHAESLHDGELYTANLRSAQATDRYTLRGGGKEIYQPRFTYHGFRYVEITGFPGTPTRDSLLGLVVNTDVAPAGTFACSNDLLNQIYHNIDWGVRGNYRSLPTDCPQRDERQGWTGDRAAESLGETFLFGVDSLYATWMIDLEDAQRDTGSLPDVAPTYWTLYNDSVTWPGAFVIIPGTLYQQYGDARVIQQRYPAMRRWMTHMATFIKNGLISKDSYGDWCVPPESPQIIHSKDRSRMTSKTVLATTYYYHLLHLMAAYAPIAGHPEDAANYRARAAAMRDAFNASQFKADQAIYDNGSQTSSILPLSFGMVPEQNKDAVFQKLVHNITEKTNSHIGTGLIGAQWLMRALCDNGRPDLAFALATQTTYPSWGYMVKSGATTIWELWNGNTAEPSMNSGNHVMLVGDLAIWMFEYLGGIRSDFDQPGFKHIILKPVFAGDLTGVSATHQSPYGLIESSWKLSGNTATWEFTIPPNTHATVYIPTEHRDSIVENGKNEIAGMQFEKAADSAQVFSAVPGRYRLSFAR
jgi:alpha-L-rhamnosidase